MFFDTLLALTTRARDGDRPQLDERNSLDVDRAFWRATGFELEQALSICGQRTRRAFGFAPRGSRSLGLLRQL